MEGVNVQTRLSEIATVCVVLALSCTSKLFLAGLPLIVALEVMDEIINSGSETSQS